MLEPVSYTHLDVYKRQGLRGVIAMEWKGKKLRMLIRGEGTHIRCTKRYQVVWNKNRMT